MLGLSPGFATVMMSGREPCQASTWGVSALVEVLKKKLPARIAAIRTGFRKYWSGPFPIHLETSGDSLDWETGSARI
jgi:hypothetical protein